MKRDNKPILLMLAVIVFFVLFFLISYWSPLAGEDWVYGYESVDAHPLWEAIKAYFGSDGRILSTIWGFIVPRNKYLWDILNPCLFLGFGMAILEWSHSEKHRLLSILLVGIMVLTVSNELRCETYTWVTGTTYVIPVLLSFVYMIGIERSWKQEPSRRVLLVLAVLSFTIPLWQANNGLVLTLGNGILLLYSLKRNSQLTKRYLLLLGLSLIGTGIVLLSPGHALSLGANDAGFISLSFFQQVQYNMTHVLTFIFIDNAIILSFLSFALGILFCQKRQGPSQLFLAPLLMIFGFGFGYVGVCQNLGLGSMPQFFGEPVPLMALGLGYTLVFVVSLCLVEDKKTRFKSLLLLGLALGTSLTLLTTPSISLGQTFGTTFFFMALVLTIFEQIQLSKPFVQGSVLVLLVLVGIRSYQTVDLYYTVHQVTKEREEQIAWYANDYSVQEGWIVNYPEGSVYEGANVQPGDEYYETWFKRYYNFSKNITLNFYYREDYSYREDTE